MTSEYRGPHPELEKAETKYFSEKEVVEQIKLLAAIDEIDFNDLEIEPNGYHCDSRGHVIYLSMRTKSGSASETKSGASTYTFIAKGDHGPSIGDSKVNQITKEKEKQWPEIALEYDEPKKQWIKQN